MPTATMTTTEYPASIIPLKGSPSSVLPAASTTTTAATLRSLYHRAARAFLHRDIEQTHSLLASAFSLLQPPSTLVSDSLATHRKKWDLLRITLETTVYSSPADDKAVPAALRDNRVLSPQTLIQALYDRSLVLYTPASYVLSTPTSAFLPSQVLITLVLSSMKLDCPDLGRTMIEDWLAKRGQFEEAQVDVEGYEKVLDIYCLHVLPRLEEWDYAKEFLQYEGELPSDKRNGLTASLQTLYTETMDARRPPSPPRTPTPSNATTSPLRTISPAPSASSSSSSLSTTSTQTAVPRTPRSGVLRPNGLSHLTSSVSSTSLASDTTVKRAPSARPASLSHANGNGHGNGRSASLSSTTSGVSSSSIPRPPRAHAYPVAATRAPNLSTAALLRAALGPILNTSLSKIGTFVLLFVLLPLISVAVRVRRRQRIGGGLSGLGAADAVRRRLAAGQGQGVASRVWGEVVRAIGDTVRMGGGGLV